MSYVRRRPGTALMRAYPTYGGPVIHRAGMGQLEQIVGEATGQLAPLVSAAQSIFGGNPATGANAQRQAAMYSLYAQAMTSPGSQPSVDAAIALYTIANQIYDPVANIQRNNPQATRTYATQALQALASQGWENVNSLRPQYTGVQQSGEIFAANQQTGQQQVVGQRPLARARGSSLLLVALGIAAVMAVSGGRSSSHASATVHTNRYRSNRSSRRRRRRRSTR